jgi:hypothetical protein
VAIEAMTSTYFEQKGVIMKKIKILSTLLAVASLFFTSIAQSAFWNWTHVYVRNNTDCEFVRKTVTKVLANFPKALQKKLVREVSEVIIKPHSRKWIFSIPRRHSGAVANFLFLFTPGRFSGTVKSVVVEKDERWIPHASAATFIQLKNYPDVNLKVKLVSRAKKGSAGQISYISRQSKAQFGGRLGRKFRVTYRWYGRLGQLYKNLFITINPLDPNVCKRK